MFARKVQQSSSTPADTSLTLRLADGKVAYTFSPETITSLRRMLTSLMYQSTLPKSIACIAALREEGVTYTSLAMATTLASDINAKVCVVELNWCTPSMHVYLEGQSPVPAAKRNKSKETVEPATIPNTQGIGAVLRNVVTLDQALVRTSLPNLSLLPAGNVPLNDRSALARSAQLKACIEALQEQFDYVILDVPAISLTSDAVALASLSEAVCLVVQQGVTPANTVKLALDEVKHRQVLGVILNQVTIRTPRWILNLLPQE